jgi:BirA family biotin operon repressor/biotin-[acetyl-CoA-carboxylase] ligase
VPLDIEGVRAQLPERRIDWHASIDSTMFEAARLAASGCTSGTAVVAEEQTAGVGRYQRQWHSEPESGLYVSVVLRFRFAPDALPLVTMALGLATVDAILKATGVDCDLRWPNDVLINDKKCAGILTRLDGPAIIAGIGINVNHAAFPPDLRDVATSLRIAGGRPQSREKLLVALLPAIDSFCAALENSGKQPILEMFAHASSYISGRRVRVDQGDSVLEGTTAGLTPAGFLIVRDDRGKENVIIAGGVRPCS